MAKILITGGSGFIGSHLAERLFQLGHEVTVYDIQKYSHRKGIKFINADIRDFNTLNESIKGHNIVCHLAAMLGVVACINDRESVHSINIEGTQNVINSCIQNKVENLLFASSSEVYGEGHHLNKLSEENILNPKSYYGISKMMSEIDMKSFSENTGAKSTVLRYCNVYGDRQRKEFVIPVFLDKVLNDKPLTICGDGKQIRSFTYVDDAVNGTVRALFREDNNFSIFNIGSNEPIEIRELASKIIKLHGKGEIEFVSFEKIKRDKQYEVLIRIPSIEKAQREIGYNPTTRLEEGLELTYSHYSNNVKVLNVV